MFKKIILLCLISFQIIFEGNVCLVKAMEGDFGNNLKGKNKIVFDFNKLDKAEQERLYNKFCYTKENMPVFIFSKDLQCKDCKYRNLDDTATCDMYRIKPNYVIQSTENCKKYEKKTIEQQVDFDLEDLLPGFCKK
jgi:hypothetical protein